MVVKVDKRVELMNFIQQISECKNKQKHPDMFVGAKSYVEKIYNDFGKFAEEEIVKLYSEFEVNLTTAVWLAYDLDENYNFTRFNEINASEKFVRFLKLLPKFAQEIKFDEWFAGNRVFYDKITAEYAEFLERSDFEKFMKWFYRADYNEKTQRGFCLMPSMSNCNMCIRNGNSIICHVSVANHEEETARFVAADKHKEGNAHTAVHEFSHWPLINVMVDDYFKTHELFSIDTQRSKEVGVYNGKSVIIDSVIEAIVQVYMRKNGFVKSADARLKDWEEAGFKYILTIYEYLQEYISNIDSYTAFSEFLPQVLDLLKEKQSEIE